MRRRPRNFEIFSLSFLDVISCGFGAVVLLVLISPYGESVLPDFTSTPRELLEDVLEAEARVEGLQAALERENQELQDTQDQVSRESSKASNARQELRAAQAKAQELESQVAGLEAVEKSLQDQQRASITVGDAEIRDDEVGGIPVDADYVIFIVDTSGSMQSIWTRVTREVENIIRIHPRIKGFQILNDNGLHLVSGYQGRWIPDTPARRDSVIRLFRTWKSASNSSPVEGLEVALKRYVKPGEKVSIYIFGDDYSGSSYDPVIRTLTRLNRNRVTGKTQARVHAIGFISQQSQGRFETLMREVTRQNDGSFLALPVRR